MSKAAQPKKKVTTECELPDAGTQPIEDTIDESRKTFSQFINEKAGDIDTSERDTVPSLEVLENDDEDPLPKQMVPSFGLTDRIFTENDDERLEVVENEDDEELVPSESPVSDELYTE